MKDTPFTNKHIALGAKMAEFAGYNMPISYEGLVIEHNNVRNAVGVFDVSHMGEFRAKGQKAHNFVQYCTSNNIDALYDGKVLYTVLPNGDGGIVDDMLVYRISDQEYFMVPNAANIDKDWRWMSKIAVDMGLELGKDFTNESDNYAQLAVQGPLALKVMQKLTATSVEDMEYYTFKFVTLAGVENVLLSTTGYTGAGGCELYFSPKDADKIWDAVFEAGKEFGIKPAGLGCRDTLRLEMGFCLYGHEIDDETSPIEAGLNWLTKFEDGNDFIDRKRFEEQKANGVKKKLVGFEMIDKGIPRQGYEVCDEQGNVIGKVCSGTQSPSCSKAIGTAHVQTSFGKKDTIIYIKVRDRLLKALVVKMPFYKG
ncbi:MAG: glycine cleavage system aminomethyltransferase GcvT [Bacteroidales bacterium]|jgi:aminomethyltransferase|nr:glycine cleavage system aminomethyltransferase GcvT [Bacteroidales bacterium]